MPSFPSAPTADCRLHESHQRLLQTSYCQPTALEMVGIIVQSRAPSIPPCMSSVLLASWLRVMSGEDYNWLQVKHATNFCLLRICHCLTVCLAMPLDTCVLLLL